MSVIDELGLPPLPEAKPARWRWLALGAGLGVAGMLLAGLF